jgi:hypothetical protein
MTNTKKAILVSVSVLVLGAGIYFATKTNKNGKTLLGRKKKYIDEGDINQVPVFSPSQKATALYNAMNIYNGTDEQTIIEELTGVTQNQFVLISKAFGLRNYNRLLGYNTVGGASLSLKTWLKEELSTADYNLLRKKFPMHL